MKKLYYIFVLGCLLIHTSVLAQNNATAPDFDPIQHPIAMEVDTGIIVNIVSDYVLIKSLRAQVPGLGKIVAVRRSSFNGQQYLQYETAPQALTKQPVFVHFPLVRAPSGAYYVSATEGDSCSGCGNNCFAQNQPPPCGCCKPVSLGFGGSGKLILKKVSTKIELFNE
jgi:hypothetical protein